MAMTPEKRVKNQVKILLDEHGAYHFSPPGMGLGRAGIPDIIVCLKGFFIGIECKAGKGQLTALQERELKRIEEAGGTTFVAREHNIEELEKLLQQIT